MFINSNNNLSALEYRLEGIDLALNAINGLIDTINDLQDVIVKEAPTINLINYVKFDKYCDKAISLIPETIIQMEDVLSFKEYLYKDKMQNTIINMTNIQSKFKKLHTQLSQFNPLNNVENIINIYHKFYNNGFNAQLKPNDYKPIFSKTIDNNLFEVVLVIPELLISKDEYNCISISVFINGELDSPIFDLTQLDEVFSFINNYNV